MYPLERPQTNKHTNTYAYKNTYRVKTEETFFTSRINFYLITSFFLDLYGCKRRFPIESSRRKGLTFCDLYHFDETGDNRFKVTPNSKNTEKQAQRQAAAGRSRHKSQGEFSIRGRIFPHDAQK